MPSPSIYLPETNNLQVSDSGLRSCIEPSRYTVCTSRVEREGRRIEVCVVAIYMYRHVYIYVCTL